MIEVFTKNARGVQAVVKEFADLAEAFDYAAGLCGRAGGDLAAPGFDQAETKALSAICREKGVELKLSGLRQTDGFYAGLTRAARGLAESGTIVVESLDEEIRLASMLAEVHLAVLPKDMIVPDLDSLAAYLDAGLSRPPGYLAFITGPSRTADIELRLALGAHGPKELHILLVEKEELP